MPNTTCLYGPPFSLNGSSFFADDYVNFQISFDDPAAQDSVLRYEWFLDDRIEIEENTANFSGHVTCGKHQIGVRILTHEGWSGVKKLQFDTCKVPTALVIEGPATLNERTSAAFYVFQQFSDNTSIDVTAQYSFIADQAGTFISNQFTAAEVLMNTLVNISAIKEGVTAATKPLTIIDTTGPVVTGIDIVGPDNVNEGESADYSVILTYSNGATADATSDYVFSCDQAGSFNGRTFTADLIFGGNTNVTIYAYKNGAQVAFKDIVVNQIGNIYNLDGPNEIEEGQSASFFVFKIFPDGSGIEIEGCTFSSGPGGSFNGNTFTADMINANTVVTINAYKNGILIKQGSILVHNIEAPNAGVLVVDFYNNTSLNLIGLIENTEVTGNEGRAYTGHNFVPAGSAAASALILASDLNSPATTNWRFEFNIGKLLTSYPGTTAFVFCMKGRSGFPTSVNGVYSLRSYDTVMTMNGPPYMPSVTAGTNITGSVPFFVPNVPGGANGNYAEHNLAVILRLRYTPSTGVLERI